MVLISLWTTPARPHRLGQRITTRKKIVQRHYTSRPSPHTRRTPYTIYHPTHPIHNAPYNQITYTTRLALHYYTIHHTTRTTYHTPITIKFKTSLSDHHLSVTISDHLSPSPSYSVTIRRSAQSRLHRNRSDLRGRDYV